MKTLQESIIGRKGALVKFTKSMLKSGYVVRYKNNPWSEYGMYFSLEDLEDVLKHQDTKKLIINHIVSDLHSNNDIGAFISKPKNQLRPAWNPLIYYYEDLCSSFGGSDFDIVEIYPIKTKPRFLDQESLEKLIKNVNPIEINQ